MARLEYIKFDGWRAVVGRAEEWERDEVLPSLEDMPQIFWSSGEGWAEANHWALEKLIADDAELETVKSLMKHLHAYANFLEASSLDWRHFPMSVAHRAIVRFRGALKKQIDLGSLASSTAKSRMGAVVQFYRHAQSHDFVNSDTPMWRESTVIVPFYDDAGFARVMSRASTDLAIPNRSREGVRLEDGLLPLSVEHMTQLLEFTADEDTQELHLMLTMGCFTGARIGTITTLRIEDLESAAPDPYMKGFFMVRVGPGTRIATKGKVKGVLLVPDQLLNELKRYASCTERLLRERRAKSANRSLLFLTKRGNSYSSSTINRLMTDLRRNALRAGLRFMARFKFHQTRATYGTWLMKVSLGATTAAHALEFVKGAMLHKHESTTFTYIRFLEVSKGKQEVAEAFTRLFTGISKRNWNQFEA